MPVIDEIKKINELIKRPCNIAWDIPFIVNCYDDVLKEWNKYKVSGQLDTNIMYNQNLKNIFDFHIMNIDHIVLYWSSNQEMCLLMCKINNKYINLEVPMLLDNMENSFIATYT